MNQNLASTTEKTRIEQDFQRDVWCLLGLPVDNLTLDRTKNLLREKAKLPYNTVLSTINVNWVVQSFSDPAFREAIINSDIVVLDGKPLLWLARLLGYPMTETVAGSTLIQELHQDKTADHKLSIFLFGGENDTAEQAAKEINKNPGGLTAVGFLNPGFGTVDEISSDAIIDAINHTKPDILLVALGAKKGMQWIEQNRERLDAKIISHLGATINFLAGTVQRAPLTVRQIGMEWVWRIMQEPKLFPRYAIDGLVLLRVLLSRFWLWRRFISSQKKLNKKGEESTVIQHENDEEIVLTCGRNLFVTPASPLRKLFSRYAHSKKNIKVDFQQSEFADGVFFALLLVLLKHQQVNAVQLDFTNTNDNIAKLLTLFCVKENIQIKQ
jgi:N-acetylglucosaminyldiphosphoundecaprenol N-acetyl-beta-D-mannosaminyltransferase